MSACGVSAHCRPCKRMPAMPCVNPRHTYLELHWPMPSSSWRQFCCQCIWDLPASDTHCRTVIQCHHYLMHPTHSLSPRMHTPCHTLASKFLGEILELFTLGSLAVPSELDGFCCEALPRRPYVTSSRRSAHALPARRGP